MSKIPHTPILLTDKHVHLISGSLTRLLESINHTIQWLNRKDGIETDTPELRETLRLGLALQISQTQRDITLLAFRAIAPTEDTLELKAATEHLMDCVELMDSLKKS